jgi:hypothetical protein
VFAVAEIEIDEEFAGLIPPLTEEEHQQLEANLLADGCRDPLAVWAEEGILLDGHNRYRICQQHGIDFDVREVSLESRDAAQIWIIKNQFGRRNLTPYQRAELALKLEPLVAAQAKENQVANLMQGDHRPVSQNSAEREAVDTRQELARVAGVSHDTISRLFVEYVPDNYRNRLNVIRDYAVVAVFDRKVSREYALGEDNRVSLACYLSLCRRLGQTQPKPPKFFLVIGRDAPPWELVELDIHTGQVLSENTLTAMNWRVIWRCVGLVDLRDALRGWIDPPNRDSPG